MVTVNFVTAEEYDDGGYFGIGEGWKQQEYITITCEKCGYGRHGWITLGVDYLRAVRDHKCQPS